MFIEDQKITIREITIFSVSLAAMVVFLVLLPSPANAEDYYSVQVGRLSEKAKAKKLVSRLWSLGYECNDISSGNSYKVLCGKFKDPADSRRLKMKLRSLGYRDAFFVHVKNGGIPKIISSVDPNVDTLPLSVDQTPVRLGADIMGRNNRRLHPFFSLTSTYTDNLYSTKSNRVKDYMTNLSLGLWFSGPPMKNALAEMFTYGYVPGGVRAIDLIPKPDRRRQLFLQYRGSFMQYADNSSRNYISQKAQAYLGFKLPKGHTLVLDGQYLTSRDPLGNGIITNSNQFNSNRLGLSIEYMFSPKTYLDMGYAKYAISYDEALNFYKNRADRLVRFALGRVISGKTKVFLEYSTVDIKYDELVMDPLTGNPLRNDRTDEKYSIGVRWEATGKTTGLLKVGSTMSSYPAYSDMDKKTSSYYAASLRYDFSSRTALNLGVMDNMIETDFNGANYARMFDGNMSVAWKVTHKTGVLALFKYQGIDYFYYVPGGDDIKVREDQIYSTGLSLRYFMARWISFELGVKQNRRTSDNDIYDYTTRDVFMGITASF